MQASSGVGTRKLDEEFLVRVYEQVKNVPWGWVCTYGTIAELAGYPKAAREVGTAMSRTPPDLDIPAHRIVNAKGTLAPSYAFGGEEKQRALLEEEGISFTHEGIIAMKKHRWPPRDDVDDDSSQLALPL